jgi:predicted nucleic acid-binding protein
VDGFDADVLVYAAMAGHPLGRRIRALFDEVPTDIAGVGSVLLIPELLSKPVRAGSTSDVAVLASLLGRLDLRPVDHSTAELAAALGASYRLRVADVVHLATAVAAGADRFVTNNRKDFAQSIAEIDITYPTDLPDVLT